MKNIVRSALIFVVGTMLNVVFFGWFGPVYNVMLTLCRIWDILWVTHLVAMIFYMLFLNAAFYALRSSQKRYVSTLPRDKCISAQEDFILFVKQEGIVVLILYIVVVSLQIFVFKFNKSYWQGFFFFPASLAIFKNNWVNLAVCVIFFAMGYSVLAVLVRKKIRKNRYDFLFENNGGESEKK